MSDPLPQDLFEAVAAARELTQTACHLADIAARATRHAALPETAHAGALALEASVRAAQTSFALRDSARSDLQGEALLWLAMEAISIAQETIEVSREALESVLAQHVAPLGAV